MTYIEKLEKWGWRVYYPARDTDQDDRVGFRICDDNVKAIKKADEVHIFFDPESRGSLFDLGAAFALGKKLVVVNIEEVRSTPEKSFANVIIKWSSGKK